MFSRPSGVPRRIGAALAGLILFAVLGLGLAPLAPAFAHEGHDHGPEPAAVGTGSPRVAVQSEAYELVGILKRGVLTLYLDRFADNAPVSGAAITATLGDVEVAATPNPDGTYAVRSPKLAGHGALEVVFAITGPDGDDLLIGTLRLPEAEAAQAQAAPASLRERLRAGFEGVRAAMTGEGQPRILAGLALGVGLLLGLALRSRSRWLPATAMVLVALLVSTGYALAHEGHDHGPEPAAAASDAPQRLPDGGVFLPKPSQRLLEVRTLVVKPETAQRGIQLIGRVIADPNRSGLVQSINGGRVTAPDKGRF